MSFPTFADYYGALYEGRSPFPWQALLVDEVLERGWSDLTLDIPTGAGKTTVLDIALYCLARAPSRMPRRTVLVVDRRIIVDQAASHAREIRSRLNSATSGAARTIADALRVLQAADASESCVSVAVMRGGMPRDNDWARRPDQPVLGISTVDQLGSRLLFRGYGISPRSASIHAGLIGNDTLILLDEVHLAVPFARSLKTIVERYRTSIDGLPDRFAVVQMSATAGATKTKRVFGLGPDDRAHPVLASRLKSHKRAKLVAVKVSGNDEHAKLEAMAERAVAAAIKLQEAGARVVGIVVNRVDTARFAIAALRRDHLQATDSVLVTGRMRPIDRDRIVRTDLRRADATRQRSADDRPLVVVATQCIEAGADLDFDALVTECASLDALRQRFGRVDRRGALKETHSIILGRSDQIAKGSTDPVYGTGIAATWEWLSAHADDDIVDFGIEALPAPVDDKGAPRLDLLAPHEEAPVMMPAHVDSWAQTSIRPTPDPDVARWLHGPHRTEADVQLVWRVMGDVTAVSTSREVLDHLEAVRPSTLEAITVPLASARRWLLEQDALPIADVVASDISDEEADRAPRMRGNGPVVALRWSGDDSELVSADEIRPGDVLVVDVTRGGLRHDSFDPSCKDPVLDVGDLAQLRARGRATLRMSREALAAWALPAELVEALPVPEPDESRHEFAERARAWIEQWPATPGPTFVGTEKEWSAVRTALASPRSRATFVGNCYVLTARVTGIDRDAELSELITEDDDSSFRSSEVTLGRHSADVRELAGTYARNLGLGSKLVDDIVLAGWLHDVGKADPRFQRWLVGGDEVRVAMSAEPLAKSALPAGNPAQRRAARERAGYPDGYRHELLSLAMVASNREILERAHDADLVLHLVASHHGWCRPFAPPNDDPEDIAVTLTHGSDELVASTRHQLARLDSGVIDRYWALTQRYGWWGLAWLEAILRLADHRASEQAEADK